MSAIVRTTLDVASNVGTRIGHTTNRLLPPKQREAALENLRAFSLRNPKLASFLAAQTALAGLPILLFLAFAIATFVVSLVTCVFIGAIAALLFTLFVTGFALLFVVLVVFIGSCTASIAFLWGLAAYLVLQRINGGETPVQPGSKVGNALNELTGGRLRDLVDRADADAQQTRLAIDLSQDKGVPKERETGCQNYEARGSSPRRRHHGQTNGSSYGGEVGEEGEEGGVRSAEIGTRHYPESPPGTQDRRMSEHSPAIVRVVDWKPEFQQEGLTA
ncbi:uncharacterized protein EKO05_0002872 [Ascochyta rabiei]|uniref:Uncharacterized protein n=1 Tax=Didymella rabiei TaxID=5454 RepID=A0A163L0F6_DIDRA|nr:uncharacterized protein EKO05_0002872 [Ascochyta rabiei]KZM27399.1 hypothetical protein ST47_g1443 [Ascochyta rabiei]UPX12318.1 hypothetical protein EKO05_0002872 [Ascochyta rabiei]